MPKYSKAIQRLRQMVSGFKFRFAEGDVWDELDCQTWNGYGTPRPHILFPPGIPAIKIHFARGLAIGLAWWMWKEELTAQFEGRKGKEEAWERARKAIAQDEVMHEIQKELEIYCSNDPGALFLDAVSPTIWKVAKRHGAPLPELTIE